MSQTRFYEATRIVAGFGLLVGCAGSADAPVGDSDGVTNPAPDPPPAQTAPSPDVGTDSPDSRAPESGPIVMSDFMSEIQDTAKSPRIIVSPMFTSPHIQLRCESASRECFIKNKSGTETIYIDGYSLVDDADLVLAEWTSADGNGPGGMQKLPNATPSVLGELQVSGSTAWVPGEARSIGFPFGTGPDFLVRISQSRFIFTSPPIAPSTVGTVRNAYILGKLVGDVNNDCIVNRTDLELVITNLGPGYSDADVNYSGAVDLIDGVIVQASLGKVCVSAVVTTTADAGAGSLRQAVLDINAGLAQGITFSIAGAGPHAVQLSSPLPAIATPIAVNVPPNVQVEVGTASAHAFSSFPSLTKVNTGTLVLAGAQSHVVGAYLLVLGGGVHLNSDAGGNLKVDSMNPTTLSFGSTQHLASLGIGSQTTAAMTANGANVLVTGSLNISSSNGNTGKLDLTNNDLIVRASAETRAAVLASVTGWLSSGSAQPALTWNGSGINSSTASADPTHLTALGVMLNSGGTYTTFAGQSVTTNDILVKYTYYGDANLSGVVNNADQTLLTNGLNSSLTGWYNGDFNYSGSAVNAADATLFNTALTNQGSPL